MFVCLNFDIVWGDGDMVGFAYFWCRGAGVKFF